MHTRNLGRAFVIIGILGIALSMGWWASYYNQVVQALGPKPALTHPMRCLLWASEICTRAESAAAAAKTAPTIPPYTSGALLGSFAVLLIGLFVVYRSNNLEPYPATPPGEPKLFIPKLEPFYAWVRDLSWPLIRIAAGGTLLGYGLTKIMSQDIAVFASRSMAGRGLEPALILAYVVYFLETVGALMIIFGLLTRFVAVALSIEFFIITFVAQFSIGYGTARGWSLLLLWGLLFFAIALRGGGPYSLDRLLRREL